MCYKYGGNYKNRVGQIINGLYFIEDTGNRVSNGSAIWLIRCYCGKLFRSIAQPVMDGSTQSCGCYHDKLASLNGTERSVPHNVIETLLYQFPEVSKEWDYEKNYPLTPDKIKGNSNKKVYWLCLSGHSYESRIANRTSLGRGCPYCAGKKVLIGYNDLLTTHPEICKEWDYDENPITPQQISKGHNKKVCWVCKNCGYKWKMAPSTRTCCKCGCPKCKCSKGEIFVEKILIQYNMKYIPQKSFNDLYGNGGGKLKFDFYLPEYNTCIEFQGQQHYKCVDFSGRNPGRAQKQFKDIIIKDQLKRNYCQSNRIHLLAIPFYRTESEIEKIIHNEFFYHEIL